MKKMSKELINLIKQPMASPVATILEELWAIEHPILARENAAQPLDRTLEWDTQDGVHHVLFLDRVLGLPVSMTGAAEADSAIPAKTTLRSAPTRSSPFSKNTI
jgi:hypothetical protein